MRDTATQATRRDGQHQSVGYPVVGVEERHDIHYDPDELCARVQPVHYRVAGEELAERYVLQHMPASLPSRLESGDELLGGIYGVRPASRRAVCSSMAMAVGSGTSRPISVSSSGLGEDLLGRAVHEYAAAVKHDEPVGYAGHVVHAVADQHDGGAGLGPGNRRCSAVSGRSPPGQGPPWARPV
jgi:hypothetical protein